MQTETTTDLILRKTTGGDWRPLIKHFDPLAGEERVIWAGPLCDSPTVAYKSILQALQRTAKQPVDGATGEPQEEP